MKIKNIGLFVSVLCLLNACSWFGEKEEYYEQEKVELDRPPEERAQTLTDLAIAYYQLGKYTYAEEYLEKSLLLDDNNAITYQMFALVYERRKNLDQAQIYFDKALAIAPENFDILTSYAVFLYKHERQDEAFIEFNKVADSPFYKNKWVSYTYLGYYELKNKQKRQAEKRFYYALQINEFYAPALLAMSRIRYDKGEMMSARAYIERYFSQAGNTLDGLQLAVKIERALQSYDKVEEYQLELKRKFPFAE